MYINKKNINVIKKSTLFFYCAVGAIKKKANNPKKFIYEFYI